MNLQDIFKDNCGCGLIANYKNRASRKLTTDAIQGLGRMMHRGAVAADGKSGDGSGILFSMPEQFMRKIAEINGFDLPDKYAVGVLFLTEEKQKEIFNNTSQQNDLKILFYRKVPTNPEVLGKQARKSLPNITQVLVVPNSIRAVKHFSALLYLTRKEVEHRLKEEKDFYIASFSSDSIAYKGLFRPTKISDFYLDLQEEDFETSFAIFHQRFSTNTLPRWRLAQPFRTLAHNGEINSIQANRFNAKVLSEQLKSSVFSEQELARILPVLEDSGSDSATADNMFEFLIANGVDFFKAARSLIPPPWQNAPYMDASLRAFYEYTSCNFEAWDGPAALNMTNGRYIACVLDRNGLRPAKYRITYDKQIVIGSEYGIVDIAEEEIREQGKLKSGEMIAIDLKQGAILKNEEINDYIKQENPYSKWLNENSTYLMEHAERNFLNLEDYSPKNMLELQRYHNITNEVVEGIIKPMMLNGKEETGAMGDDTPMACFSKVQRNFTDFFRQKFAQVTNPAIDPIREKLVMSTSMCIGAKNNILDDSPVNTHRLKMISPFLSKEKLDVLRSFGTLGDPLYDPSYKNKVFDTSFRNDLRQSLHTLGWAVANAVKNEKIKIILLDDRYLSPKKKLIPMAMVVGYLNHFLLAEGVRSQVSIIPITGEVYDSHSFAVLIAYGAVCIYPYLLLGTTLQLVEKKRHVSWKLKQKALLQVKKSIVTGLLKILSKMGISTLESYHNSGLFDIIGLSKEVVSDCFANSEVFIPGLGYCDVELRLHKQHRSAYKHHLIKKLYPLEVGSYYKYMSKGEYHDFSPDVVQSIHQLAHSNSAESYKMLRNRINSRGQQMIRDFFELNPDRKPITIAEVEPASEITRRFCSAAMSLGSISPEAHEAIAEAMNTIGGFSNSGEGGEDPARFNSLRNSKIKQIASGRFGVTPYYLRSAQEIQIKVAQGAKPGEGGQLPGAKVSPLIASLRCTIPGLTLISPPPHHDIYSIEDLAQLIFDLKQVNPKAQVSVKLVSSSGVGTIAVGVAKAYADKIIISGADGGTGAAQLGSIKFAGNPWEIGLSETHNMLKANHLREFVELQTDGGLKTGLDVVKAAILGAESYAFGTSILTTVGCKILRICHLNKCSVGIATQNETLRAYYIGTVKGIVSYLTEVAEEVREILAELGYASLNQIIGKNYLLKIIDDETAKKFDFTKILYRVDNSPDTRTRERNECFDKNEFEKQVLKEVLPTIYQPRKPTTVKRDITNTNRSFGALISGEIADIHGDNGLPKETLKIELSGDAGQSLGAFMSKGMIIQLTGTANDYVGKGMRGGHIIILPKQQNKGYNLAGNTCLYGATGGKLFVAGKVGERFAIRNSGTLTVVEGTGDHPCEYMTGGTVVILGDTGHNFGAGMTGGTAFVYDKKLNFMDKINRELILAKRIDTDDQDEARYYLKRILKSFYKRTQSLAANYILEHFREETRYFWMVTPKDMKSPLNPMEGD